MRNRIDIQTTIGLGQHLAPLQLRLSQLLEMPEQRLDDEVRMALEENPALDTTDEIADEAHPDPRIDGGNNTGHEDDDDDYSGREIDRTGRCNNTASERYHELATDGTETLAEHLMAQLTTLSLTQRQREIARYIIDMADTNGYMVRQPGMLAIDIEEALGFEVDTDEVATLLETLRSVLDPPGVLESDLRHVLRRQVPDGSIEALVLDNDDAWAALARGDTDDIARGLAMSDSDLAQALRAIRRLDPRPGAQYGSSDDRRITIVPDFVVEDDENNPGRLIISMPSRIPELTLAAGLDQEVVDKASQPARGSAKSRKEARALNMHIEEARILIQAIDKRRETMMAVMKAIVSRQREFFNTFALADLSPLLLRDIADDTGYDVSTISRATSNKYVQTSGGIYPLKIFFNEASGSGNATAHSVIERIRALIAAEDPEAPLTDKSIAQMLVDEGLDIARRTVAKYRDAAGIPGASRRKNKKSPANN